MESSLEVRRLKENFKGQIVRFAEDLEQSKKIRVEIKNRLTQQEVSKGCEYSTTLYKLKKANVKNIWKLKGAWEKIRANLE